MSENGPTFMCIGAQKAGTTWLYANLRRHPDVALPPLKEIHYFDEIYRGVRTGLLDRVLAREGMNKWWWKEKLYPSFKGVLIRRNSKEFLWYFRYFFLSRSFGWYERLFDATGEKVTGDITPDYCILSRKIVQTILERYPDLKIIYIIRNPVDRAWSALKMRYVKRRNYLLEDINEELVEDYYQKFGEFNDIQRTITNWGSVFPENQFFIGLYDELVEAPEVFFEKILAFLGLRNFRDHAKFKENVFRGVEGRMPAYLAAVLRRKSLTQIRFLIECLPEEQRKYPEKWMTDAQSKAN